jgi:hypothetical protein
MTREEKLADRIWYYIRQWSASQGTVEGLTKATVTLDRELQKALKSKSK